VFAERKPFVAQIVRVWATSAAAAALDMLTASQHPSQADTRHAPRAVR